MPSEANEQRRSLSGVEARIGDRDESFPAYAVPRVVVLSLEPCTVEAGLLTPTLKPKRAALEKRFASEFAGIYRRPAV